jgi:hypothetical protein
MTQQVQTHCHAKPGERPLTALPAPPRLVHVAGLYDASGEPVLALATGSLCRPVLRVFRGTAATFAALHGGGAA